MKETFLTTYSFVYEQTVDSETGEIVNSKLLDKKVVVSEKLDPEDETPRVTLESNKVVFNNSAIKLIGVKPGTLMDIKYKVNNGTSVPVLGTAEAFNVEGGNKLTKSNSISFRGVKNDTLSQYGKNFILEKTQRKGEFLLINKENIINTDDKIGIDESKNWKPEEFKIENPEGLEADDDIFKF